MTDQLARLYALLVGIVVFFVTWAAVAAHPWRTAAPDPRLAALAARRAHVRSEAIHVRRVLAQRYAAYRVALRARQQAIAAARAAQDRAAAVARRQLAAVSVPAVAAPPVVQVPSVTATHSS